MIPCTVGTGCESKNGDRRYAHQVRAGHLSCRRGFTLLEILVALSIMAMAVTVVLQLFSANLRSISAAGDMSSAAVRGEARIREILMEPYMTETSWSEVTGDGYHVDVAISEVLKERTDTLPVKLMEVALTIRWMEGRKQKSLTLKSQKTIDKTAPAGRSSIIRG